MSVRAHWLDIPGYPTPYRVTPEEPPGSNFQLNPFDMNLIPPGYTRRTPFADLGGARKGRSLGSPFAYAGTAYLVKHIDHLDLYIQVRRLICPTDEEAA